MSDYSILQFFCFLLSLSVSRWLSSKKGDCGTSVNLQVIPQQLGDKKHNNNQQQQNTTITPAHISSPSIDPTQTLRHAGLPPPTLNFSTPFSKNYSHNTPLRSAISPQHTEPVRAHDVEFEHGKDHIITEGGGYDKSIDDYDGGNFESDSEVEEGGGSEVESEGEGQSSFRGGERSDAEADHHNDTFSDTQELDSSITNQYLRQLRYIVSRHYTPTWHCFLSMPV